MNFKSKISNAFRRKSAHEKVLAVAAKHERKAQKKVGLILKDMDKDPVFFTLLCTAVATVADDLDFDAPQTVTELLEEQMEADELQEEEKEEEKDEHYSKVSLDES